MGSSQGHDGRAPVRIAVVGAGTISQAVHLPAIRRLGPRFDLRVVCDASPGRAAAVAAAYGPDVRATTDPEQAIGAADIEAVLLATPGSHCSLACRALEAGRHVLAEKPFSLTVGAATRADQLARRLGLVLQVGYMKLYDPMVERAAAELATVAEARLVRITVLHPADAHQVGHLRIRPFTDADPLVLEAAEADEVDQVRCALGDVSADLAAFYRGILLGSVVHQISLLRGLGVPLPLRFDHAERWPEPAGSQPTSLLATATLGPATRLALEWCWLPAYPEYVEEVAVFAADARLALTLAPPYLLEARSWLRVERGSGTLRDVSLMTDGHDSGFVRQLIAFADSVRTGSPPRADAAGAAADVACLQALLAAVATRQGLAVGGEVGQR
ncbi:MAG TPA: Gfo/Idh/MocA family oxidoreductase [Verrucomicrobiae bacterium]|nr:Gfo/Idh/MocA family oxidoreductase [Verrucomicrobiae bacterium]